MTKSWGSQVWKILHIGAALKYPPKFYRSVVGLIPCPVCVSHYNRNFLLPPDEQKLVNFHSMVNAYHVRPRKIQMRPPDGGWIEHYKKFTEVDIVKELDSLQRNHPNLRLRIERVKGEIKSFN